MSFNLTITDCSIVEAQLHMVISEIIKAEELFIVDDYSSLAFLMDSLEAYYGDNTHDFVTDLWCEPERFAPIADKMERFAKLIREACALSDQEKQEIRRRIREERRLRDSPSPVSHSHRSE